MSKNVVKRVTEIIQPLAQDAGLDIWDILFKKEGSEWYLRVFIDKPGGVTIDDCVDFNRAASSLLDEYDPIDRSYTLEVSSPGIERVLRTSDHFKYALGKDVFLRLIRPRDGVRDFKGKLISFDENSFTLEQSNGQNIEFNLKDASYVKLDDFDFNDFNGD